jgi:hypothetical protein
MKALPALTFLAATFAFLLLPLRFEITASILSAAGLMAIVVCDYSRSTRRVRVSAPVVAIPERKERFGLAA